MSVRPRVVVIIQARMGSVRLPGKVLMPVNGRALLDYQIERIERSKEADQIVVATSRSKDDDAIESFCKKHEIVCHRGDEENVLERFYEAAQAEKADVVVRLTGDCPLIDCEVVDRVIRKFLELQNFIYVSNTIEGKRSYPRGLDVEVFSNEALRLVYKNASSASDREHVTPAIIRMAQSQNKISAVQSGTNFSNHRWTVDTEEDFELIQRILKNLYPQKEDFDWRDVVALLDQHPDWIKINQHIEQKKL